MFVVRHDLNDASSAIFFLLRTGLLKRDEFVVVEQRAAKNAPGDLDEKSVSPDQVNHERSMSNK